MVVKDRLNWFFVWVYHAIEELERSPIYFFFLNSRLTRFGCPCLLPLLPHPSGDDENSVKKSRPAVWDTVTCWYTRCSMTLVQVDGMWHPKHWKKTGLVQVAVFWRNVTFLPSACMILYFVSGRGMQRSVSQNPPNHCNLIFNPAHDSLLYLTLPVISVSCSRWCTCCNVSPNSTASSPPPNPRHLLNFLGFWAHGACFSPLCKIIHSFRTFKKSKNRTLCLWSLSGYFLLWYTKTESESKTKTS